MILIKKSLKYDIIQDNSTFFDLPNEFGQTTLVIDSCEWNPSMTCPPA